MYYWYVLFVKTGREQKSLEFLERNLNVETVCPFLPMSAVLFKKSGYIKKEVKPLFSSYVFAKTYLKGMDFLNNVNDVICRSHDIIRVLKDDGLCEIALRPYETEFLSNLLGESNCIDASKGIIKNDKVYINDGPLVGRENVIRKIDRHKREAIVELEFMGRAIQTTVALEIVRKIESRILC